LAEVKSYVAKKNTAFKVADIQRLTYEAADSMQASAWVDCLQHAEKLQEDDFNREIAGNDMLEPIVTNQGESDSEETKSSSENG
jgi:hypothetical protein